MLGAPRRLRVDIPRWDNGYPDAFAIRREVDAMVDAVSGALIEALGDSLAGLWLKGSSTRPWDSPLDYVPELSDVDLHYSLAGPVDLTTDALVSLHAEIDSRFAEAAPDALHTPRPQLLSIENVENIPGYLPCPVAAVRTLCGAVPQGPPADLDPGVVRRSEAGRLVSSGGPGVVRSASLGLLENPGHHLFRTLRALAWHVSPVGGRVVAARTGDFERAWSANRTTLVTTLTAMGEIALAEAMVDYYTSAWRFFLSGWRDADSGRAAFRSAIAMMEIGARIGRDVLAKLR
jgi:hypothetical protein